MDSPRGSLGLEEAYRRLEINCTIIIQLLLVMVEFRWATYEAFVDCLAQY
jgi:hypothetical protein